MAENLSHEMDIDSILAEPTPEESTPEEPAPEEEASKEEPVKEEPTPEEPVKEEPVKKEKPRSKSKRAGKPKEEKFTSTPEKLKCDLTVIIYLSSDDGDQLKSTLSTVQAAAHEPVMVYVDDGHFLSPQTESQIKKFSRQYSYEEKVGAPKSLNIALDSLETTWYLVLQPGDVLAPGALDRIIELIQKSPEKKAPEIYAQQPYTIDTLRETPPDYPLVIHKMAWLSAGGYLIKQVDYDWRWAIACAMARQNRRVCVVPGGIGHCSSMPDPATTAQISTEVLR